MADVDLDALLQDVSPEAPCGPDLSYDPLYLELERLAQGAPERQVGDSIIPAEEPDWADLSERCVALLGRTKDLRIAMQFVLAQLRVRGVRGMRDGLALLRRLIEQHWNHVHPQLDPDDRNDPTARVTIISQLSPPQREHADVMQFRQRLREARLCDSKRFGRFSLRDMAVAGGQIAPTDPTAPKLEMAQIEAAFEDTATEELQELYSAAEDSLAQLKGIQATLLEKAGADHVPDLKEFTSIVSEARGHLQKFLQKRGAIAAGSEAAGDGEPTAQSGASGGEIRSTRDVIDALDRICRYYDSYEPSSPIPLLLRRAQRLVSKNFMDIIKDLSPGSLSQIEVISGTEGQPPQ